MVNHQLLEPKFKISNFILTITIITLLFILTVLSIYYLRHSDPYIESVLSNTGNAKRGEAIFQINCAGCHGSKGDGNIGPTLQYISRHKSDIGLINQVVGGKTPPMPKFQPSSQDMADLLSYLKKL